jgi:serine/threonine-protein phosphatase 2A regulatory subunit B''
VSFQSKNHIEKFLRNELVAAYQLFVSCNGVIVCRDVHQKWIEGGNYELCIEDVRDEIWDMVKPADPLRIALTDLLSCKQGGTIASMLIDVRGFWAHDNRENLLQEEEEQVEEA